MKWNLHDTFDWFKHRTGDFLTDETMWGNALTGFIKILIIFILSRIVIRISSRMIQHMTMERERNPLKFDARRTKTIGRLISNVISYTIHFIAILLVLSQLGINLMPLLAGAGVVGLAIGFGAQSLVKDVITGFFIIFEDQFAVGDVIQTGKFKGTVEEIGLRVTRIRNWTGEEHIVPNGLITEVTNFSIHTSIAVIDVPIPGQRNIEKMQQVIEKAMLELYESHDSILQEPVVLGVESWTGGETLIRVTAECKPNTQADMARAMRTKAKKVLDGIGLEELQP